MTIQLSGLQRSILRLLLRNETEWDRDRLYFGEVLADHFDFPTTSPVRWADGSYNVQQDFDLDAIGKQRFAEAEASVAHAAGLLQDSGMVSEIPALSSLWSALTLTEAGRDFAFESGL